MLRGDEVYGPKNSLNDYFVNFTVYLWEGEREREIRCAKIVCLQLM